jgi:hypothetical protein
VPRPCGTSKASLQLLLVNAENFLDGVHF